MSDQFIEKVSCPVDETGCKLRELMHFYTIWFSYIFHNRGGRYETTVSV